MSFHREDSSDEYGFKDREMMEKEKQALDAIIAATLNGADESFWQQVFTENEIKTLIERLQK